LCHNILAPKNNESDYPEDRHIQGCGLLKKGLKRRKSLLDLCSGKENVQVAISTILNEGMLIPVR